MKTHERRLLEKIKKSALPVLALTLLAFVCALPLAYSETSGASSVPEGTPTASDQSDESADLSTTQAIRQAIMANDELSFMAKNITIVTVDGKVTLRGTVKNEEEKKTIESHARTAASGQVESLIEVQE